VWCVDISDALATDVDDLAVGKGARRRSAISAMEILQPTMPCMISAWGAAASHSFIEPHSSALK